MLGSWHEQHPAAELTAVSAVHPAVFRHFRPSGSAGSCSKLSHLVTSRSTKLGGSCGRLARLLQLRQFSTETAVVLKLPGSTSSAQQTGQCSCCSVDGSAGSDRSLLQLATSSCCSCGGRGGSSLMRVLLNLRQVKSLASGSRKNDGVRQQRQQPQKLRMAAPTQRCWYRDYSCSLSTIR